MDRRAWIGMICGLCVLPAAVRGAGAKEEQSVVTQDITIRGKFQPGPGVASPAVKPEKPVVDEVLRSLHVYNSNYEAKSPKARAEGGSRRLSRPFPAPPFLVFSPRSFSQPYDRWKFEVFAGTQTVWRTEGVGPVVDQIAWDGADSQGRVIARIGEAYRYRFTGAQTGGEGLAVASDPVELTSIAYRENSGGMSLEVGNAILFEPGRSSLLEKASPYLEEMALRLGKSDPRRKPYHLVLYQRHPKSKLAQARSASLARYFSKALLVNASRIYIEALVVADRGDITACLLPLEAVEDLRLPQNKEGQEYSPALPR